MRRGKLNDPWVNPEVLGFARAMAHTKGPERTKPCMLSDTNQQHANFVGLAYQGKGVMFRSIMEYSSVKDFGP
jgi:hypothetical protein